MVFPVCLQCFIKSKGKGKDQESIQSNETLNPGHTIREYDKNTRKDLIQVIQAVAYKAASHRQDSMTDKHETQTTKQKKHRHEKSYNMKKKNTQNPSNWTWAR